MSVKRQSSPTVRGGVFGNSDTESSAGSSNSAGSQQRVSLEPNPVSRAVLVAAVKLVALAALVGVGAGLLLTDVLVLHDGIRESSLTEVGQEFMLFAITLLFWFRARQPGFSGFGALTGGLFGCMLIRELDGPTDLIHQDVWQYPAYVLAIVCLYTGWRDRTNALSRFAELFELPSYGLLLGGLMTILVFSRMFGVPVLWQHILTSGYVKTAKHAAEEGTELLGYCLCLAATLDYIWETRRRRI